MSVFGWAFSWGTKVCSIGQQDNPHLLLIKASTFTSSRWQGNFQILQLMFSLWKGYCIVSTSEQPNLLDPSSKFPLEATSAERALEGLPLLQPITMCKVWTRPCSDCRREMMLSGPSTSETHKGHREPCETYRRLQAEWGDRLTMCDQEVSEHWHGTGGVRKCDTCQGVTREQARIRRTTERKAKQAARKQELENKRACQQYRDIIPSAMSLEAAEAADVNSLPSIREPMIHQDTGVKSELPTLRYGERRSDEDVAWNLIADIITSKASQQHEAQAQPKAKEAEVKQKRGTSSLSTSPPLEIQHHYTPSPPHNLLCNCVPQRHKISIHHEVTRMSDTLHDALFFDQFTTKAFEYDPTWRAACGAVMSLEEQGDVVRFFLEKMEEGFGERGG